MNINSQINYIITLKMELDDMQDARDKEAKIQEAITRFFRLGYSNDEIRQIFMFEEITEAEDHTEMIKNHQQYIEMVDKILRRGNNG